MAIIFDVINNVIEVESPATEVTIQNLINAIREFEDDPEGIVVSSIANASGKQSLGPGKSVGITLELINDWRVEFEARESQTFCYVRGGNLVATNQYNNNPIKPSTNVNVVLELSTSVALIVGEGGDTSAIAEAVWNEKISSHTIPGTFGEKIDKKLLSVVRFLGLK